MDRSNLYNIIHLSLSFFLIFMSYNVTQTFQTSSDYAKDGAFAIGIIYLVFCLGNLALSSYITQLLGVRLTLILSSLTYVLFIACNIKYNKWTLYICAFLLGFGAALLWTAQGVYVTISTNKHEQINNLIPSSTRGFMNGIFFGLFQLHQIIGNLLVSFLFHLNFDQWIIFTIMTSIAGLGMLSLIFLRNIKLPKIKSKTLYILYCVTNIFILYLLEEQSILSSLSILLDIRFILLIPAMCYNGLSQGFIFATIPPLIVDKSRKYLMFALFGTITAFNFIVVGKLSDLIGRRLFIFIIGALAHMIIFGLLLTIWKASLYESRTEIFVMLLTGLSIGDTIFSTLLYSIIASIYGETRPADAFACLRLFQSGSTAIAFVEQVYIRFSTQVLCRIIVLSLTVIILIYEHYCVISFDVGKTNMSIEKKRKKETEADMEAQIALTALTNKA